MMRIPSPNHMDLEVDSLENQEYENDSELGDDLNIDESGNVLKQNRKTPGYEISTMAHILAGYGTDICEQLIEQFIKQELHCKQLSILTETDLEMLGVANPEIRHQMITEFSELPNQEIPKCALQCTPLEEQEFNDIVLQNVFKHLNCLKTSLSIVLLRMYTAPTENVLINDHTYASKLVLQTLDEFSQTIVGMEKTLVDLQYGKCGKIKPKPNKRGRLSVWVSIAAGMFSIGGFLVFRYMNGLKPI